MPKNSLVFPFTQTHVKLTDYDYKKDLDIRKRMAHLSEIEVELLQEIIHQSLKISVSQLAKHLNLSVTQLLPLLDKWEELKLFKRDDMTLIVDKETRKLIEFQLERFDNSFEPNLNFLQSLLDRLPQEILLDWYSVSRTAQEFFPSIVNHFLINPQVYIQYLDQLEFKNSILKDIIKDVFTAKNYILRAEDLKKKYHLSQDLFELYILVLEYHFACFLDYQFVDGFWEEIVTPLHEWQEILKYRNKIQQAYIRQPVDQVLLSGLDYIDELKNTLKKFKSKKGTQADPLYQDLVQLKFLENEFLTKDGNFWLTQTLTEQMSTLANHFLNEPHLINRFGSLWATKQLRLIDSSLRQLEVNQWVRFDLFIKGLKISIGDREPLALKLKGKKWKYQFPVYNELEKEFIEVAILERLSRFGVIEVGKFQGHACFRLTPCGSQFIS